MKKLLVILLISSILLTQCYTQNDYLTKDYSYDENDKLIKVIIADNTEKSYESSQYRYKIESDSLLIVYEIKTTIQNGEQVSYAVPDTLLIENIHSQTLSEYDAGSTFWLITIGAVGLLGLVMWDLVGFLKTI